MPGRLICLLMGLMTGMSLSGCARQATSVASGTTESLSAEAFPDRQGRLVLRWIERPGKRGPSVDAEPDDVTRFEQFLAFNRGEDFAAVVGTLREGDLIAYRMSPAAARKAALQGNLNTLGYGLLAYGHLAIVVQDPQDAQRLVLFSSESFIGPNTREGLKTLADHDWDAFRLDQWDRVDTVRLHEFVGLVEKKAGHWYGYDFSGMFGLWNSNLKPADARHIGHDYICSTAIVAALYYSGVELDAVRHCGVLDLCSPKQVLSSAGCIMPAPEATLISSEALTPETIALAPRSEEEAE